VAVDWGRNDPGQGGGGVGEGHPGAVAVEPLEFQRRGGGPLLTVAGHADRAHGAAFGAQILQERAGHDELAAGPGVNRVGHERERGVGGAALGGEVVERAPEVDERQAAALRLVAAPGAVVGHDGVVVRGEAALAETEGGIVLPRLHHRIFEDGRREHDGGGADRLDAIKQLHHVGGVAGEGLGLEVLILAVVHAEQDGDVLWPVGGDIGVEPREGVGGAVAADAGVVEADPTFGGGGCRRNPRRIGCRGTGA
jgi:hypothetical protein